MEITFGIDDGYVGNRPHTIEIDDQELAECETSAEREQLIDDAIQEWKDENLHPYWKRDQLSKWELENEDLIAEAHTED